MTKSTKTLTRRQTLAGIGGVSLAALAGGCAARGSDAPLIPSVPRADQQPVLTRPSAASQLLDDVAYRLLTHQPERATGLGVDTGEYAGLRSKLEDQSREGKNALAATMREDLARLRAFPRAGLDADTVTNLDVVESGYALGIDGLALPYGDTPVGSWRTAPYVVIQNCGTYIDMLRFMEATHPVKNEADGEAYLARLQAYPGVLEGERQRIVAAREMGVVPPDFLLDKAIKQMEGTITAAKSGKLLVSSFEQSVKEAGLESKTAKALAEQYVKYPIAVALEAQLDELKTQRAVATSDPGMWARPQGDEWYAWALRSSTTTNLTPDEVHEQGLEELAALHARMDPILRDIGYTSGTVGERMQALSNDPRYKFAEGDAGREEIMEFIWERINWIKGEMPRAFNTLVDPNLEVRRIPINEEAGAPGAYGGAGSKDGSIPGRFWINLRTTDLHRKYDLADLTYHEAIPGHVWEGEYSNRLPLIRSILAFNPFSEGWALYGEQLADELGAYDDFTVGRLGYLQSLAFRACRMVVDTGLHAKRWSRDRAVNFFVERNGSKRAEVESEVDRYCSWPGQATGYKLGHSRIVELRTKAARELGSAYDMKAFNDAVILGGNAPMDVLAKNVDRYIAATKT